AAPSGVVAAAGAESAGVSWLPPVADGGSPITSYTVTASPSGATATVSARSTNALIRNLVDTQSYTFTVTAANPAGSSVPSAPSAAATPGAGLGPPAVATASASPSSPTTVSTGSDPSVTGGTTSTVTVPSGTSGGTVTVMQSGTSTSAPGGYQFGGV